MTNKYSELFRSLADKIEKNDEKDLAGAFLIIPPAGDHIEGILIGKPDMVSFFGVVKNKLDMAVTKADEEEKRARQFGR